MDRPLTSTVQGEVMCGLAMDRSFHAQLGIALSRVMGFDGCYNLAHTRHYVSETVFDG